MPSKCPSNHKYAQMPDGKSEKKYASEKKWSLHRLEHVVLFNLGLGMNRCEWFRDYFGLKENETFEEKLSYYQYDPDAAQRKDVRG